MDLIVRRSIARIDATIGPGEVKRGAGALVERDLVLTGLHVVADRECDPVRKASVVRVAFPDFQTTAELIEGAWDANLDFALLRLKEPCPETIEPLVLSPAVEGQNAWESYGFPDAEPEGLAVTGKVVMVQTEHKGAPAMQLDCNQAGAGIGMQVHGLSGAPCLVQGRIVGVIRRSLVRPGEDMREVNVGGVLYACPATEILSRIAAHLPPSAEAPPMDGAEDAAFAPYVSYLRGIAAQSEDWPSWSALEKSNVWVDEDVASACTKSLQEYRLAIILGGRSSGKTTAVRTLAHRFAQTYWIGHWDFELYGSGLPDKPINCLRQLIQHAKNRRRHALLVLENVHLAPTLARELLGLGQQPSLPVAMLLTARVNSLQDLPPAVAERVSASTIDLSSTQQHRGWAILNWWLDQRGVSENERRRVISSVPWGDYVNDLWVLRLALQNYDWQGFSLPAWAIHASLEQRLDSFFQVRPGADDLFYVVSALGKYDLDADLQAVARMVGRPKNEVVALARDAAKEGLMYFDHRREVCRYWHASLARLYWDVFGLRRDAWAQKARGISGGSSS